MSTIKDITDSYVTGNVSLSASNARVLFIENPEAIKDLTYGPTRRILNALPPHNHGMDGGESLYEPILSHSFGRYKRSILSNSDIGIPLGPLTTAYSSTDPSTAKKLFSAGVIVPGGVKGVRITIQEYHELQDEVFQISASFRNYSDVNYKYGIDNEITEDFLFPTVGNNTFGNSSVEITDLSLLGDPTKDRELEFSLWLTNNFTPSISFRLCSVEILPLYFTDSARLPDNNDLLVPSISYRELQASVGVVTPNLMGKVKEIYNNINRGIWGNTPGLLNNNQPDTRINYQSTILGCHKHQGLYCTDIDGNIYSDGACLLNSYSTGYCISIGDDNDVLPNLDNTPVLGAYLHTVADLSSGWLNLKFRYSIPNGLGALKFRFGIYNNNNDTNSTLSANVTVIPINDSTTNIVTGLSSRVQKTKTQSAYCELTPVEDDFFESVGIRLKTNRGSFTLDAALSDNEISELNGNSYLYRVTEPLIVNLTHPPTNSQESAHQTTDYMISIKFKLLLDNGDADTTARIQWLNVCSADGY